MSKSVTETNTGDTAVVVLCHEVDERIRRWHVHTQPPGLPAHITVLFPFKPMDEVTEQDVAQLRAVFAAEPMESICFTRTARFPGVLYLEPDDDARFRRITDELTSLWPEFPPYGGLFEDVIPHLTVTHGIPEHELDAIERELAPHMPFETRPEEGWLMTFDGEEWSCEAHLPFQDVR